MEYKENYGVKLKEWHLGLDLTGTLHHTVLHLETLHTPTRTRACKERFSHSVSSRHPTLIQSEMALLEDAPTTILETRS